MTVIGVARFERFFRAAAGLDIDKNDVKRYSDFVEHKLYDLLLIGQGTAKANGRDVITPRNLPITKGLQESIHDARDIDSEIQLRPILEQLAVRPPLDVALAEETETRLPGVVGGLSLALARAFKRTLALPVRGVAALRQHREQQDRARAAAGDDWKDSSLVFTSRVGTELDAHNVRRAFRKVAKDAGLNPAEWTPRELRHSFVSLLSDGGMSIEDIADLCGHSGTAVTETVYRHQLRPVLLNGAVAMDEIFDANPAKQPRPE
jgi:hypothetical protein